MNNTIPLRTLGLSILLAASLAACKDKAAVDAASTPAADTGTATPAAAPGATTAPAPAAIAGSEAPAEAMAIPATADGIWTATDLQNAIANYVSVSTNQLGTALNKLGAAYTEPKSPARLRRSSASSLADMK